MHTLRTWGALLGLGLCTAACTSSPRSTPTLQATLSSHAPQHREDTSTRAAIATAHLDGPITTHLNLGVELGAILAHASSSSFEASTNILPSNLLLHLSYLSDPSKAWIHWRATVSAGAPLAIYWNDPIPSKKVADLGYTLANASQGWSSPPLWSQNSAPISLTNAWRTKPGLLGLELHAQVLLAWLIAVNNQPSYAALSTITGVSRRFHALNASLHWHYYIQQRSLENSELDQHALNAQLTYHITATQEISFALTINLDQPYGVAHPMTRPTTLGATLGWTYSMPLD